MSAGSFFRNEKRFTVVEIAKLAGAEVRRDVDPARYIDGIAALDRAGPSDLVFFDRSKFAPQARRCPAGACLTSEPLAEFIPSNIALLIVKEPFSAFVNVARTIHPSALRPTALFDGIGPHARAVVHPSARLESGVNVDPGAVIGAGVEIGSGTVVGANAVIGTGVRIGRDCSIGAHVSIAHALVGDRVILHPGCRIGQDGFGFIMSGKGHRKVPQIGRVIIQDDVEIGAGTSIDRGGLRDTVVGEGTKIDNQVQVGHNVVIGRHCVLVSQVGIAGSVVLEDGVVLGGQVGIADNLTIGEGARLAARSGLISNVPAGATWMGYPAMPIKDFYRMTLANRAVRKSKSPAEKATPNAGARREASDE